MSVSPDVSIIVSHAGKVFVLFIYLFALSARFLCIFLNFLSVFSFLPVIITYTFPLEDVILSKKYQFCFSSSAFSTMKETMFSCFLFSFLHFCIIMVSNRINNLHNQPVFHRKEPSDHELQKRSSAGYPDYPRGLFHSLL